MTAQQGRFLKLQSGGKICGRKGR